jgi:hypothetical protein
MMLMAKLTLPPARSKAFGALIKSSQAYLTECQDALKQEFLLASWPRYDWSQATCQLAFSDGGRPKVVADIQFAGSISTKANTWLWAWANTSVASEVSHSLLKVREYGDAHGFPHLTLPEWGADEQDGWAMTAVATFLLRAKGAYRSPDESGFTFMVMTAIGWVT